MAILCGLSIVLLALAGDRSRAGSGTRAARLVGGSLFKIMPVKLCEQRIPHSRPVLSLWLVWFRFLGSMHDHRLNLYLVTEL